ncbi:MAG: thioredoxin family protein [Hyphomicrobiaceae bacterium]
MPSIKFLSTIMLMIGLYFAPAGAALAASQAPYTQQAFAASQHEDKPILVDISATWCPICAKQHPIIDQLAESPMFGNLVIYKVDFDTQKDVVRSFGAQMQSTLIVFHGSKEKGRSVGDTDLDSIKALLLKAK